MALQEIVTTIKQNNIQLIMIELPTYPSQYNRQPQAATLDRVAEYSYEQGIPYWITSTYNLIPPTSWADYTHMYITGSYLFSNWLGKQVGAYVEQGYPSSALTIPPIDQLAPEMPIHYGLSPHNWEVMHQTRLIPANAIVFDPSSAIFSHEFMYYAIGLYLEWSMGVDNLATRELLNLMTVLEQTISGDFSVWRQSKHPDDIPTIDYLLFPSEWLTWLTPLELATMEKHYQEVASWQVPPLLNRTYYLLQVKR